MSDRMRNRVIRVGAAFATLWGALVIAGNLLDQPTAQAKNATQAPKFQVDPLWPKPLPNHWVLGSVTGVAVDSEDHIWIVQRGADSLGPLEKGAILDPPTGCCVPAPQVLEFDEAGNLLGHWGGPGPGFDWPRSTGGLSVAPNGNVWIAAAGLPPAPRGAGGPSAARPSAPAAEDAQVVEFSGAGQFVFQIGHAGKVEGNDSTTGLNRPAAVSLDPGANEVYVADGLGNRRVVVFDATTGAYKRHWGAYGGKPDDSTLGPYDPSAPPAKQFREVTCAKISKDGLVYVCDRQGDRIQVFRKDGTFVKEVVIAKATLGDGSAWDVAFSNDPRQRFLYVADGQNKKVWIIDRTSLAVISSFGDGGRYPGLFYGVGSVAVDSKGNVYTGETYEGKRVQKFAYKGLAPAGQDR
jgi:DNA-binding beta-propeller fold protein YncE